MNTFRNVSIYNLLHTQIPPTFIGTVVLIEIQTIHWKIHIYISSKDCRTNVLIQVITRSVRMYTVLCEKLLFLKCFILLDSGIINESFFASAVHYMKHRIEVFSTNGVFVHLNITLFVDEAYLK